MKFVSGFALLLFLIPQTPSLAQDGTTRSIALTGDLAFDLTGNYKDFFSPVINDSSTVAFSASSTTSTTASPVQAIYRTTPSALLTIAKSGQTAPVLTGTLKTFSDIRLNSAGLISFFGTNGVVTSGLPRTAVYTSTGTTLSTIASYGQPAPGLTGNATIFAPVSLSDSGSVAFKALISDGSGDTTTPNGLYLSNSATSTTSFNTSTIATTNNTAPTIGGLFTDLDPTVVQNNLGTSLFLGYGATNATTFNTAAGLYSFSNNSTTTIVTTSNTAPVLNSKFLIFTAWSITPSKTVNFSALTEDYHQGIFSSSNGVTTALVTTNDLAPILGGNFTNFSSPSFSASGLVAFKSADGSLYNNGTKEHFGVFTNSNGVNRALATTRQVAPQIGSNFTDFSSIETNDVGTTAFLGSTATGSVLCLSDGQDLVPAAFTSQIVSTSTIKSISFSSANDSDGASGLNNLGQVVYLATLANNKKSLLTFTPTLHFRTPSTGSWSTPTNWTLGLTPAPVHDLVVDPSTPLTITGPSSPTTINRLTIGSGSATANLNLQSSGPLSASNGITIASLGKISGDGVLIANVSNSGSLSPGLPASPGSLAFTGSLSLQSTSHLSLDLGGLIRKSHYDYLAISGALSLNGNLDVSLINGFSPQVGHSFDLFDSSSVTGTFSVLNLPTLSSGLAWNTSLLPSTGVISVVSAAPLAATWIATGNGSWSSSATANWSPSVPNAPSTSATFTTTSPSPSTVTLGGPVVVGHLAFSSSSPYLLTSSPSNSLTLSDPSSTPSITVTTGSDTISTPLLLAQNTLISTAANSSITLS
ncbi:MAG: choice-of-anchor tandem repeat NxxGxxAF-containing protein, partial [Verrucomicrobiota bacterium]